MEKILIIYNISPDRIEQIEVIFFRVHKLKEFSFEKNLSSDRQICYTMTIKQFLNFLADIVVNDTFKTVEKEEAYQRAAGMSRVTVTMSQPERGNGPPQDSIIQQLNDKRNQQQCYLNG